MVSRWQNISDSVLLGLFGFWLGRGADPYRWFATLCAVAFLFGFLRTAARDIWSWYQNRRRDARAIALLIANGDRAPRTWQ